MLKKLMMTTALSGLMIGAAMAQTQPAPEQKPVSEPQAIQAQSTTSTSPSTATTGAGSFVSTQSANQWLASDFRGVDVVGANDEKIGDVNDLLFDQSGRVIAYVVGVGGFLGIGAKDVALPPSAFQVVQGRDSSDQKLKLSMTKEQLNSAADFKSQKMLASEQRRTTTGAAPGGMAPRAPGASGTTPTPGSTTTPGSTNR